MHRAFAALLALGLSGLVPAWAQDPLSLRVPEQTTLKLAKLEPRERMASFSGTAEVAGKLVAQWIPEVDATGLGRPEFRIHVDTTASASLPAFVGYPAAKIDIENGREALRKAVDRQTFDDFVRKKTVMLEVHAVFRIKAYVVGVDCDAQWARAVVVDVRQPERLASAATPVRFGC